MHATQAGADAGFDVYVGPQRSAWTARTQRRQGATSKTLALLVHKGHKCVHFKMQGFKGLDGMEGPPGLEGVKVHVCVLSTC